MATDNTTLDRPRGPALNPPQAPPHHHTHHILRAPVYNFYYQITDTLSFENNYNISSYISIDRITAPVNFEIICSLMNWEFLWGAITLNWELSWGVITLHPLPSRGVSNLCEFMFVRCQECVQYLVLVLRTFKYSCLDEWETFHLSSARRMSDLISRRFFTFFIGLNVTVRRD